jgi:hypothetical protein
MNAADAHRARLLEHRAIARLSTRTTTLLLSTTRGMAPLTQAGKPAADSIHVLPCDARFVSDELEYLCDRFVVTRAGFGLSFGNCPARGEAHDYTAPKNGRVRLHPAVGSDTRPPRRWRRRARSVGTLGSRGDRRRSPGTKRETRQVRRPHRGARHDGARRNCGEAQKWKPWAIPAPSQQRRRSP